MTKRRTLAGGICLLGIVGLCFAICADTGKKTPAPRPEPLVDPECSVVDIVTLDNRVLDVQPRDVFYLTASGPIGKTGVSVDLGNGEYGIVVRTGSRVPVAYYAPGKYGRFRVCGGIFDYSEREVPPFRGCQQPRRGAFKAPTRRGCWQPRRT